MKSHFWTTRISGLVWLLLVVLSLAIEGRAAAGDMKFDARLIWGTDEANPKDKELKAVDSKLVERLKGVFKWKHYFEVNRKDILLSKDGRTKTKMSPKCELELALLGENKVEVTLIGEGKPVIRKKQGITPGELVVLAGDSKDDTAWFVILVPAKPSEAP